MPDGPDTSSKHAAKPKKKPPTSGPTPRDDFDPTRRYTRTHAPDLLHCPNCGLTLRGQFCSRCGQNNRVSRLYFGMLVKSFIQEAFELEGPLFRTMLWLTTKPGEVCRDYIEGRRRRFMSPIRYFLLIGLIYVAVTSLLGINSAQAFQDLSNEMRTVNVSASVKEDAELSDAKRNRFEQVLKERATYMTSKEGQQEFALKVQSYGPQIQLAVSPFLATILMLLYLNRRMTFGEHLVYILYTKAHLTLINFVCLLAGLHLTILGAMIISVPIPILYSAWASRRFYRENMFFALVRQTITHAFLMVLSMFVGMVWFFYMIFAPALATLFEDEPPAAETEQVEPAPTESNEDDTPNDGAVSRLMIDGSRTPVVLVMATR